MKRFYCNGKKGYCDRGNGYPINCENCKFANGTGGDIVDVPCKYCSVPIFIKGINGEYLELPNNFCPMCGEKIPFAPKERTDNIKEVHTQ